MKKYFVQCMSPDGEVSLSVNTEQQIIEMYGFRDCTDLDFCVFDGETFGKLVPIEHYPATSAPFNFHQFVNSETKEVVFEGYSSEH